MPAITRQIKRGDRTPWGKAQGVREYGDGIVCVDTAGHGGFYVPSHLLNKIPVEQRRWAARWSGSQTWYEEDCCWAAVALAFPQHFSAEQLEAAKRTVEEYFDE